MKRHKIKQTLPDRIFGLVNTTFLSLLLVVILYPLLLIFSSSFSEPQAVISGEVWLYPVGFNLEGYKAVFGHHQIMTGYANTFLYTICATMFGVALTVMAAYPLSRKDFFGRGLFMGMFTFTMLFSGGLIPSYLLNKSLGLVDSRLSLIVLGAMSVYNVIIARTFFQNTLPTELLEATQIDGCNDFHFFVRFALPLSKTIIAVLVLFYAVGHWNSYYTAIIYIRSQDKLPLQVVLRNILLLSQTADLMEDVMLASKYQGMQELLKYALIVVASAPILMLYPFIQKYFVKGVMIGSLKG